MPPSHELRTWTRQLGGLTYTCSTDPSLLRLDALNAAFGSDMLYWAKPLAPDALRLGVEQSLCFGLYVRDGQPGRDAGPQQQPMIGFARLITDYVTFGYLTDVYVLAAHQGRGLARWMMQCLDEVLVSWPDLRRCMLLTGSAAGVRLYRETIGAHEVGRTGTGPAQGLFIMIRERPSTRALAGTGEGQGAMEG